MKISIKEEGKKFIILIPTSLIFSSFSFWLIKRSTFKIKGIDMSELTPKSMRRIRRTISRMRKIHKKLYLVEVEDGDSTVKIKL